MTKCSLRVHLLQQEKTKKREAGLQSQREGKKIIAEVGAKGTVIEGKVLELGYIWGQMSGLRCRGR